MSKEPGDDPGVKTRAAYPAEGAVLLLIDFQQRLMPAIGDGEAVVARAVRLAEAARLLDVRRYTRPSRTR